MACKWEGDSKRTAGHLGVGSSRTAIPAELHFQTSKKIAQLTKVIYTLNVRLDEQECALEFQKEAHEERIQQLLADTRTKVAHYKAKSSSLNEIQQRLSAVENELTEERRLRSLAELEAKRLRLSAPSSASLEHAQCWQRLVSKLKALGGETDPLNADLDVIWNLLRGTKGNRAQVVADIPEKDCQAAEAATAECPGSSCSSSLTGEDGDRTDLPPSSGDSWRCPSCGGLSSGAEGGGRQQESNADQEEELLERLAENERMTERLQQEIGNLEKSLASKDQEVFKLQKKVCSQKSTAWTQTEETEVEEPGAKKDLPNKTEDSLPSSIGDELRRTLAGFQTVAQDLRETKVDLERRQRELKDLIEGDDFKQQSAQQQQQPQEPSKNDRTSVPGEKEETAEEDVGLSENSRTEGEDLDTPPTARETKEAQTEFKAKVAQLLQQMTLLMTAPELSSCNMSDAEKECVELRKRLRESHEQHKAATLQKEADFQEQLRDAIAQKDAQMQRQEQEQHTEFENTLKHLEEKWQRENSAGERDHALIAKLEGELSECKRLLKSQTELQTAEMARMSRDLEAALKALAHKEAELSSRECCLMKEVEEERSQNRTLLQQSQQHQRQAEALSRQLDLKRDELIQLRKEAMQQIRNLENYWLEKVNKELERVKKSYSEEKKLMLENFCKAQRLLKDKILVLQAKSSSGSTTINQGASLDRSESAPHIAAPRRGSVMSQIEYCIHEEEDEEDTVADTKERICSSQPNVARLTEPTTNLKKERLLANQHLIKRAESVLLPKLQFLSFWKSASNIDKEGHHAKQQQSLFGRPRCNSSTDGVPLFSPPPPVPPSNTRKRPKKSSGLRPSDTLKCPLLFQESRSRSCCNLDSCQQQQQQQQQSLREASSRKAATKVRDYQSKRHSVGARFWIGPLAEAAAGDTDSESSDSDIEIRLPAKNPNIKSKKEPLLESEL